MKTKNVSGGLLKEERICEIIATSENNKNILPGHCIIKMAHTGAIYHGALKDLQEDAQS